MQVNDIFTVNSMQQTQLHNHEIHCEIFQRTLIKMIHFSIKISTFFKKNWGVSFVRIYAHFTRSDNTIVKSKRFRA